MGDDLPRFDRELEAGRHLGPPARQHGVRWRFVERVLHLDDGEAPHIRRLGDRPTTQPYANVHLPLPPRCSGLDPTPCAACSSRPYSRVSFKGHMRRSHTVGSASCRRQPDAETPCPADDRTICPSRKVELGCTCADQPLSTLISSSRRSCSSAARRGSSDGGSPERWGTAEPARAPLSCPYRCRLCDH